MLHALSKGRKTIASSMLAILYWGTVLPEFAFAAPGVSYRISTKAPGSPASPVGKVAVKPLRPRVTVHKVTTSSPIDGPGQPESQAFHSVENKNMVDLFSGDFSYSIPLLDVGGYPVTLGYNSGITMDQEASWVGLGWNINPGAITRNMRGLPDDFNGKDTVQKTMSIKNNTTIGASVGANIELAGVDIPKVSLGLNAGLFYNTYKGWGIESGMNVNILAGGKNMGYLSSGLSITNNSQEGFTNGVSLDYKINEDKAIEKGGYSGSVGGSLAYNSRSGLKDLQLSAGLKQYGESRKNNRMASLESIYRSSISFAYPSFLPDIQLPSTGLAFSFTAKPGGEVKILHPSWSFTGYYSSQYYRNEDKHRSLPAYGYLNYQEANNNAGALLDFNREKDLPYREKPATPSIGIPSYTYDVFSMTGEGTGGSFRAYRGDIGVMRDPYTRTKDKSGSASIDFGGGDISHLGVDLHLTRAYTEMGAWRDQNPMGSLMSFRRSDKQFEAAYFRNPGEMPVNNAQFYDAIGGDDVVAVELYQAGNSSPFISTTNNLVRFRNKRPVGTVAMNAGNVIRPARDKRTQVISYLTAKEAKTVGLTKYIENFKENVFSVASCEQIAPPSADVHGLHGVYYYGTDFKNLAFEKNDPVINFSEAPSFNVGKPADKPAVGENFSVRWTGRLKADVTAQYTIYFITDDGAKLFMNDSLLINGWRQQPATTYSTKVNLVAGEYYDLRLEYFQGPARSVAQLKWQYAGLPTQIIPTANLSLMPATDTVLVSVPGVENAFSREDRINTFRKASHLSEIDVLNADGRRYVYGLPVYNLRQKEATFSVSPNAGQRNTGLVFYDSTRDNSVLNNKGKDHYFNSEEIPAYAHSFLLTGIVSPDYSDLTGNGISDDDPGEAVRFNYTKVAGIRNPYQWRTPYNVPAGIAQYNEGLQTEDRDDKGNYIAGEKEVWYLHSVESKNMIATFKLKARNDLPSMNENGKIMGVALRALDEINLYVKADFVKYGTHARPVKTVKFEYGYDLCLGGAHPASGMGKLTLKSVQFTYNGTNKSKKEIYKFYYNNNPNYNHKFYDRWGNYKNPEQNPTSTSGNIVNNGDYPYALQDSALAAQNAGAWTLDSISLPSGGGIRVAYEGDDYAFVQNKRAMQMMNIAGFSASEPMQPSDAHSQIYADPLNDYLYVSVNVPKAVASKREVFTRYLEGADTIFFRVHVKMPSDKFGNGGEFISCYAVLDGDNYGFYNSGNRIWFKVKGIDNAGKAGGPYNPVAKAAIQFLRQALPSKAYPGSDVGTDNVTAADAIKILVSQLDNMTTNLVKFDIVARTRNWASEIDPARSFVRLNSPVYKKYGGGLRVKSIRIYDNWKNMTNQKESVYGNEYQYTTVKDIDGVPTLISSGVASYEPMIGGEENPWRQPKQYTEQTSALAPVNLSYVEDPMGESFFPSPSVGYSKVRVRTLNTKNKRSANGFEESNFYTTYDFPTISDMSMLADGKKRFKPGLANFLKINARHFVSISQGFKVELNDMNGKQRSTASYAETNPNSPIASTEYFYRVENQQVPFKRLNNTVMAIKPNGDIDPAASIGKDVELMMDMREQHSITNSSSFNVNGDFFTFSFPPVFLLPTLFTIAQREEVRYRSAATMKVINRHGLIDSVVAVDKGSKVTTVNLLYDAETGSPLLTRAQNEFNDPVYSFSYPAAWVYDGMGGAYKNIGFVTGNIYMREGKITSGMTQADANIYFAGGDEILIEARKMVAGLECSPALATWPNMDKIYAIDANAQNGGPASIFFMDANGKPYTGDSLTMKIVRSGRRNINVGAGSLSMLVNPVKPGATPGTYELVIDNTSKVIAASAAEFRQFWQVRDIKKPDSVLNCLPVGYAQYTAGDTCGVHIYMNEQVSGIFYRNDCPSGTIPGAYTYVVPANRYSTIISQEEANEMALDDLYANGQDQANIHGACAPIVYYSTAITSYYHECEVGEGSGNVSVNVPYGFATSVISQPDADTLAKLEAKRQAAINGVCEMQFVMGIQCGPHGYPTFYMYSAGNSSAIPLGGIVMDVGYVANDNGTLKYIGSDVMPGGPPVGAVGLNGSVSNYPLRIDESKFPVGALDWNINSLIFQYGVPPPNALYRWECMNCDGCKTLKDIYIRAYAPQYPNVKITFYIDSPGGVTLYNVPNTPMP